MRLLGHCSTAGGSGGCKVLRHALVAVVGEGQIKAFPTSLHCRLHRDPSSRLTISYAHLEECSRAFKGVETQRGGQLLHCGDPKLDPILLGQMGHVLGVAVVHEGSLICGQAEYLFARGHDVLTKSRAMSSRPGSP